MISKPSILTGGMGELHMEYVKEGCNTPVKNVCKSTNMLQLLKFSMFFVFGIATF
jgi:hypothetical protein